MVVLHVLFHYTTFAYLSHKTFSPTYSTHSLKYNSNILKLSSAPSSDVA